MATKWPPDPGTVTRLPSEMQRHWIVGKLSTSNPVERKKRKKTKKRGGNKKGKGEERSHMAATYGIHMKTHMTISTETIMR